MHCELNSSKFTKTFYKFSCKVQPKSTKVKKYQTPPPCHIRLHKCEWGLNFMGKTPRGLKGISFILHYD